MVCVLYYVVLCKLCKTIIMIIFNIVIIHMVIIVQAEIQYPTLQCNKAVNVDRLHRAVKRRCPLVEVFRRS